MSSKKKLGFATRQIHEGNLHIPGIAPLATPIFQTSTFIFDSTARAQSALQAKKRAISIRAWAIPTLLRLRKRLPT